MEQLTTIESDVLGLIPIGNSRKISKREIATLINVSERKVYEVIKQLRNHGVPLCAVRQGDERGYYIATTPQELADGLQCYRSQVADMSHSIQVMEQSDLNNWRINFKLPARENNRER
jgi:biotin operon repressor